MTIFEISTLSLAVITAVILVLQIHIAIKSIQADHERRKKEATLDYIQKIRPAWADARFSVNQKWGWNTLNDEALSEIESNFELKKLVQNLLSLLEHLSVGMNADIFDKDLLFRMSGSLLIRIHNRFVPYIEKVQQEQPTAYVEYQYLAKEFEQRKSKKLESAGNITVR